jgi:pSer/pThr/pTyr-binding forkhead associated (FHA) protein
MTSSNKSFSNKAFSSNPFSNESLFLEITNEPFLGQRVRIQEGLQIGRSRGEFQVKDPKISSLHAQVIKHNRGIFVLVDRQSSNKIIFNGEKVEKVALLKGIQFTLGNTKFQVVSQEDSSEEKPLILSPQIPSTKRARPPLDLISTKNHLQAF